MTCPKSYRKTTEEHVLCPGSRMLVLKKTIQNKQPVGCQISLQKKKKKFKFQLLLNFLKTAKIEHRALMHALLKLPR